jgi:hypothetical protein
MKRVGLEGDASTGRLVGVVVALMAAPLVSTVKPGAALRKEAAFAIENPTFATAGASFFGSWTGDVFEPLS